MAITFSCGQIGKLLEEHLTGEELERIWPLYAESWASPSMRCRMWESEDEEIPLRFHLNIDMKV